MTTKSDITSKVFINTDTMPGLVAAIKRNNNNKSFKFFYADD